MSLPLLVQHSAGEKKKKMTKALQEERFALAGTHHYHPAQRFATTSIQELLCKSMKTSSTPVPYYP